MFVYFGIIRPDQSSVSFVCEFKKEDILQNLNAPANNFKELTPGTQYWAKVPIDKTPKNVPSQCNYNSQHLKDEVVNFVKTHCLISDYVLGNLIHFVDKYAVSIAFDILNTHQVSNSQYRKVNTDLGAINVFYLGTGKLDRKRELFLKLKMIFSKNQLWNTFLSKLRKKISIFS